MITTNRRLGSKGVAFAATVLIIALVTLVIWQRTFVGDASTVSVHSGRAAPGTTLMHAGLAQYAYACAPTPVGIIYGSQQLEPKGFSARKKNVEGVVLDPGGQLHITRYWFRPTRYVYTLNGSQMQLYPGPPVEFACK